MKTQALVKSLSKAFGKSKLALKKHSPEILVITGVVGTVVGAVMACKASTTVKGVINDAKEEITYIQDCANDPNIAIPPAEVRKNIAYVCVKTGGELAKLYGPAILVGGLSITAILTSHNILRKRNISLAAGYLALDQAFKNYRGNVLTKYGELVDQEMLYGITQEKVEETVVDEETGKKKKVKKTVDVVNDERFGSPYAKFFDDTNPKCSRDPLLNKAFLRGIQSWANDKLRSQGFLFLDTVYEELGFEPTVASKSVGWIYDPQNPEHDGDNYIDFGLEHNRNTRFLNRDEYAVIVDFNVDGPILYKFAKF